MPQKKSIGYILKKSVAFTGQTYYIINNKEIIYNIAGT